jgi:hypothetical protein|tara:strand:+ start:323 stop:481 length:159 start_codon:yes stop_codon:yes gene_type:complete
MTKKDKRNVIELYNPAEILLIRSALLNYRKAPFISEMEKEMIGEILQRLTEE